MREFRAILGDDGVRPLSLPECPVCKQQVSIVESKRKPGGVAEWRFQPCGHIEKAAILHGNAYAGKP